MAAKLTSSDSEDQSSLAEINITPLVDVMLVLLIIFMITAPMLQSGIPIDLPEVTSSGVETSQEDYILNINELGSITINDDTKNSYSLVSIEAKLMDDFKNRKKKELFLRADKSIKYGYVVKVMAIAQRAGVERVGMITESNDSTEKPKKSSSNFPKINQHYESQESPWIQDFMTSHGALVSNLAPKGDKNISL